MTSTSPDTTYKDMVTIIERLHRRFLDVLRIKLNREGIDDINAVQVNLMINIGDEEVVIRDLIERGYYLGSNVSYNVKKLVELGYLEQQRSQSDRRSVRVHVSQKGKEVCAKVTDLEARLAQELNTLNEAQSSTNTLNVLKDLERVWTAYIHYGGK